MQQVHIRFPQKLLTRIDEWVACNGGSRNEFVNTLCRDFFEEIDKNDLVKVNQELREKIVRLAMFMREGKFD